ncbi:Cell wall synthesis protein kre9 precursor [Exophiala xenobiotica]|uniref:Cell wall synthesis protein kre9 n=1 Tax=Vermiconidia calcicola TaxID=1690605 RepID=A0AAV9Q0U8_9PEZI|nr:Cell wall synthesis protein kre9 precursor [Exophiala xenobiotica]KAK5530643.1 Cell wall synthesis protein kre9 precursor [Chaetothyriales sp. CCFEE 6169]KAK5530806.1 Cell wall synthesis protein kre9 precursor [Vermiconidia calcicola]KAK5198104.1 Cell wall synthesis protein kre9 precursor [Exophiala xenobiotica]KAK5210439.1 Cell wall synthesis protein kre9 precursor [Exophiala xenobiotica]
MILRSLLLLATSLLSFTLADVLVTTPAAGATTASLTLAVEWEDSGNAPKISNLASYQLFLCAGGNDEANYIQLATLVATGDYTDGNSVSVTLTPGIGANVQNAYFLKFISAATGGTVINFSDRFSLTGMTGTFPAAVTAGLKTVTGTAGPATQNNVQSSQNNAPAAGADAIPANGASEYSVPYTMQTATIRYAPMPPKAQTKITAKNASPQWPTSAYTVYQTNVGTPNAVTTHTEVFTFSVSSREATVAAAGQPTDAALQKFLNRWKD